jgi:hypothetical protein
MDEVTRLVGAKLLDPASGRNAAHIFQGYVSSKLGSFVEQRIGVGFSALEQLGWQRKVLEGGADQKKYDKPSAGDRLKDLLAEAMVPLDVPPHLPALLQFAQEKGQNGPLDGPTAVARVRNRLTHPRDASEMYDPPDLIVQTWVLLVHYIELLILHWVGYQGKIQDTSVIGGWAGTVSQVPWA